ncbi:unnamed protein product [Rotaria sp. Silwood2]|nr:unnamed protein product [Rotaria sp. Silwood2]CAF2517065.1 unnamed protein product [Rotaria sp. Silwood2]CAF2968159.1 unnamed protein product [Rotaria sp. Silwood2]
MSEESIVNEQEEIIMKQYSSLLSDDDDLKELCNLLDEERYKMHQLVEQWKYYGTNTIHKLASQIVDYQEKLNDLEQRQISLLKENKSLQSLVDQLMLTKINSDTRSIKPFQQNASTQTSTQKQEPFRDMPIDDSLQRQISLQNMFDAIKTAEIYESVENMTGNETSEKIILKEFCNLVWKYLEERSTPTSSCLL